MSKLFSPLKIRDVEIRNRITVSPMCQYSSQDGFASSWHLVHLGARALGGAGLVMTEATAVSKTGRISPDDLGIWHDQHIEALHQCTQFIKEAGAVPGIQLAHAGRKASTASPWKGGAALNHENGGWTSLAPSPIPFSPHHACPKEMSLEDILRVRKEFVDACKRSQQAGFEVLEIHMAHGYLLHEFLSPLSNQRQDIYGGSLENRMRFPLELAQDIRDTWPNHLPLFVRLSVTDWVDGGWDLSQSLIFASKLKSIGIDLLDCSSGANIYNAKIPVKPNYQVPFAEEIRKKTGLLTGAVGLIRDAVQAEEIINNGEADLVFLAREFLRNPNWPLDAARTLNVDIPWPVQYRFAKV